MSTTLNLAEMVQRSMDDLISAYALSLVPLSDNEVMLQSSTYAIDICADRDGVALVYLDTLKKPVNGYNIFLFLANKRRDALKFSGNKPHPKNFKEFVEGELSSLAQHVRSAGSDILGGSKDWIKGYTWPVVHPTDLAASSLGRQRSSGLLIQQ